VAEKKAPEKRVPVLAPDPESGRLRFATVNESSVEAVKKAGGKVLTKAEQIQIEQRQKYEARPVGERVTGAVIGTAAGPIVGNALAGTGTITMSPEAQAFQQGEASAITAGLDQIAVKEALEATAGKEAARAYGKHQLEIKEANEGWHTGGAVAGFAATALSGAPGGAARALPGVGISALGASAEGLAARGLAGVASRGVLGRALATGGELAARGAVEGALYSEAQTLTEAELGEVPLTSDKMFAALGHGALLGGIGGAALGGAGSLVKSAGVTSISAARGGLARVMGKAEQAAADVVADEGGALAKAEKPSVSRVTDALADPDAAGHKLANSLALDALGATKTQARSALAHVDANEVGAYVRRVAISPATEGSGVLGSALKGGMAGRADELLTTIQADKGGRIIGGLRDAIEGTGARIEVGDLVKAVDDWHSQMLRTPEWAAGADAFRARIAPELASLGHAGKVAEAVLDAEGNLIGGSIDAVDLYFTRAALERQAYEVARSNSAAGQAYKGFLRELDGKIVSAIDEAATKAAEAGRADKIRYWKKEYQLASAAEEMAEGGAEKIAHNNTFGIREAIGGLAGIATGHPLLGAATIVGGKIAKERGSAAAAALLGKAADLGMLSKTVRRMNDSIGRASQGILSAPKRGPLPELPKGTVMERALVAQKRLAEAKTDPEAYFDKVARSVEPIAQSAPELAGALMQKATSYLAFMEARMPSTPPSDPLDPFPPPRMTPAEASKIAKYDWYWEKPERFFMEVERGHLTFEGIEVAKEAMPEAFAELQALTAEGLATLAAQGRKPPFAQRQKIGDLLEFPATAAQGFEHAQFLQKNAMLSSQGSGPAKAPPRASTQSKPQRSPYDRLEASGPGRR